MYMYQAAKYHLFQQLKKVGKNIYRKQIIFVNRWKEMENLDNPFKKTGRNGYIFNTKNQLLRWDFQISRENRIKIAALNLEK